LVYIGGVIEKRGKEKGGVYVRLRYNAAIDEALAKYVWEESERLTSLTFAL
jgi:hypothetical protein